MNNISNGVAYEYEMPREPRFYEDENVGKLPMINCDILMPNVKPPKCNVYNKEGCYFECILTNGTKEDFNKLCTTVEEFGINQDMMTFKAKNYENNNSVILQIIPKNQILQIINHYSQDDINSVWENEEDN